MAYPLSTPAEPDPTGCALAHPYRVHLYADWYDRDGHVVGFLDEAEARRFAALRPEPLVDLSARGRGVIAARRLLPHPASSGMSPARDDFPQEA